MADLGTLGAGTNSVGSQTPSPFAAYQSARRILIAALAVELVLPILFAAQAGSPPQFLTEAAVGLAAVGGAVATGGLFGFVFGIPRLLQDARPPTRSDEAASRSGDRPAPYAGNTSLEQISDWLTKILVGVGLTQLANIPAGLESIGEFVGSGLGGLPDAGVFASLLVVFGLLDGFFVSYLWTRLYLPSLFAESDLRAVVASAEQRGEERALEAASNATLANTARREPGEPLRGMWVDDRPTKNTQEMQWIQSVLGVTWQTETTTEAALAELADHPDRYAFVITDMARPDDPRAGYTLLDQMRARGIATPVIVYTVSDDQRSVEEAKRKGAFGLTNSPSRLLELVSNAVAASVVP
jgi:CheY-like chemotaxis protein